MVARKRHIIIIIITPCHCRQSLLTLWIKELPFVNIVVIVIVVEVVVVVVVVVVVATAVVVVELLNMLQQACEGEGKRKKKHKDGSACVQHLSLLRYTNCY